VNEDVHPSIKNNNKRNDPDSIAKMLNKPLRLVVKRKPRTSYDIDVPAGQLELPQPDRQSI